MKTKKMNTTNRKTSQKPPRVVELRIRLLHEKKPDGDGRWAFAPVFPRQGTSDFRILARKPETARRLLEEYIYNELSGRDAITADDVEVVEFIGLTGGV